MLDVSVLAALIAIQTTAVPATSVRAAPDWRSEFPIRPLHNRLMSEWVCAARGKSSRVVVTITDVGTNIRNYRFAVKLDSLVVDGREASAAVRNRVSAVLADLNSVSQLQGVCRDDVPALEVVGFVFASGRQPQKSSTIDLK